MGTMVEVTVARLVLDGNTNAHVVLLREKGGDRYLPIWIGQPEAESILLEMNGVQKERPLTHDLCRSLIVGLGGELKRVHITRVHNRTYYAEMQVVRDEQVYSIDARPSDAMAVALRCNAPLFADERLLAREGEEAPDDEPESVIPEPKPVQSTDDMTADQLQRYLSGLRPEDFGKFQM